MVDIAKIMTEKRMRTHRRIETIKEFLARGGKITVLPPSRYRPQTAKFIPERGIDFVPWD